MTYTLTSHFALLDELEPMFVTDMHADEYDDNGRHVSSTLAEANIITSRYKTQPKFGMQHAVLLDLDGGAIMARSGLHNHPHLVTIGMPRQTSLVELRRISVVLDDLGLGFVASGAMNALSIRWLLPEEVVPTVVNSSTIGHSHLYLPVKLRHQPYMRLLVMMAEIGVIEPGYALASLRRGHSDLRLPWIAKTPAPRPPASDALTPTFQNVLNYCRTDVKTALPVWHVNSIGDAS